MKPSVGWSVPMAAAACVLAACSVVGKEWAEAGGDASPTTQPSAEAAPSPAPPAAKGPAPAKVVYLQPLGKALSAKAVTVVEQGLREFYGFEVKQLPVQKLPRSAYYQPRKRYRAEKLLGFLRTVIPADAYRILGLTASDISTSKGRHRDWGIMGLATIDGQVSVMSMFRCRRGSKSALHARERLGKVAVHEVGHTLGLEHCPTVGCLMEDARGTNVTTDREHLLCPRCRRILTKRGYSLPPSPTPPWRAPAG